MRRLILVAVLVLGSVPLWAFAPGDQVTISGTGTSYDGRDGTVLAQRPSGLAIVDINESDSTGNIRRYSAANVKPKATPTPTPTATATPSSTPTPSPTATPTPTPTATPSPTPTPSDDNCMPNPSSCGFPDVETTGPDPLIQRTTVNGGVTLSTDGQVYENKTVNGSITVQANNVTIRNVKVNGGQIFIHWGSTYKGLVVKDTEIDMGGDIDSRGILYGNYTADHVFIHNGSDCAQLDFNVTIRDSLCVVGPDADGDAWPDNNTFCNDPRELHFDGFESDGGSNYTLDHNTIRNPCDEVSAILLSTNVAAISTVKVTNNLMAGGGYTLYCDVGPKLGGSNTITGNRFARSFWAKGGYWGPVTDCASPYTVSGNVWDSDGSAVTG